MNIVLIYIEHQKLAHSISWIVIQAVAAVGKVGMLLDVHGHTHSHGMVELGYKISG